MARKCMQCGGSTKKMAKGGMPSTTPILGPPKKPFAAGIPFYIGAGQTGPSSMKRGGSTRKMQNGGDTSISVRKVSANDPYEVEKRRLQQAKLSAAKKHALGIAAAKHKKELQDNKNLKLKAKLTGKMQTGGTKMVSWMKDGLSKSTGKRRIVDSKVSMTGPDAPMGKTPMAKKGGTVKAKRFAALAPPYNKATAADRIAGAKKNAKKK